MQGSLGNILRNYAVYWVLIAGLYWTLGSVSALSGAGCCNVLESVAKHSVFSLIDLKFRAETFDHVVRFSYVTLIFFELHHNVVDHRHAKDACSVVRLLAQVMTCSSTVINVNHSQLEHRGTEVWLRSRVRTWSAIVVAWSFSVSRVHP
jgi:hypothetical protein